MQCFCNAVRCFNTVSEYHETPPRYPSGYASGGTVWVSFNLSVPNNDGELNTLLLLDARVCWGVGYCMPIFEYFSQRTW